ncbi:MAG: DUF4258 domain-containing protein [bacterium]|nr:DUF4258 domain-containing protein [bacterium]
MNQSFLDKIREAGSRRIVYTSHALDEMNAEDEMISTYEVKEVVLSGDIIEDYPDDKRGHSCLMLGFSQIKRPVHVVCSPRDEFLWIITAYIPEEDKWEKDFKTRKRRR